MWPPPNLNFPQKNEVVVDSWAACGSQRKGKFLIIGGGIANFTDVAATFTGLIKALDQYAAEIKATLSDTP
eukprot:1420657-Amphidinium_carterae.1